VRLALVLADRYHLSAQEYIGRVLLNDVELFAGDFSALGVVHGKPFGQRFENWKVLEFSVATLSQGANVVTIENNRKGSETSWFAIESIELELVNSE
jgi:hypothetical protein